MKLLKGWRTRLFAGAHLLQGAVMTVTPDLFQMISSDSPAVRKAGIWMIGQGVIIYVLRQITTTPPGEKY